MRYSVDKGSESMKKPASDCLKAVQKLTKYHSDDCATYYSLDGESAVIVISDPDIAHKMVCLMSMIIDSMDAELCEVDGVPVLDPIEPIEA